MIIKTLVELAQAIEDGKDLELSGGRPKYFMAGRELCGNIFI